MKIMIVFKFNILKFFFIVVSVLFTSVIAFSATFTVTNTGDDIYEVGSLRWAINEANNYSGPDRIVFNIPGSGPHTIQLGDPLIILEEVNIDGYSQPGTKLATKGYPAVLKIEIDGSNHSNNHYDSCLEIYSANNTIGGLAIYGCDDAAIDIYGGGNIVVGNNIGTDVTGTFALGNDDDGVRIWDCSYNRIERNIIIGAHDEIPGQDSNNGVEILLSNATYNLVQNNNIGLDAYGRNALGFLAVGVQIKDGANHNTVASNFFAGSGNQGIHLYGYDEIVTENNIVDNHIGTKDVGEERGYSTGIRVEYSENNIFNQNTITGSGWNGLQIRHLSNNNKFNENTSIGNQGNGFRVGLSSNGNEFNENIAIKNGRNGFSVGANIEEEGYQVSSNNIFTENTAQRNGEFGFFDQTTDSGTLGTANAYSENQCKNNTDGGSNPTGLCRPQP
jgi:hypothetical protein